MDKVKLGKVLPVLIDDFVETWDLNAQDMWVMGFGKDVVGRLAFIREFKRLLKRGESEEDFSLLGIYQGETNLPVGYLSVSYMGDLTRTAEIFIYIAPRFRRQGYGSEGLKVLLEDLFKSKIHRAELQLLSINDGAVQFFRDFGFTQEGIKRASYWMGINSFDVKLLRMLKPEWKKLSRRNNVRSVE